MTRPARLRSNRPLVIAHRGASAQWPEHTLVAYQRAIESGADGVECDVRLTKDGHLVCIHDRTLGRTSTGAGTVSTKTLAELQRLDFGSWHGGEPAPVLTFTELLGLLRDAGRPVRLLAETKHPTRYGPKVERRLVEELAHFGWTDARTAAIPVTVMSFTERALRRVHELAPQLPTVLLLDTTRGLRESGLLPAPIEISGPSVELLRGDPSYVERAHTLGNEVYVWTVDEPADLALVIELGVDAIITNRPAEAVVALDAQGAPSERPPPRPSSWT